MKFLAQTIAVLVTTWFSASKCNAAEFRGLGNLPAGQSGSAAFGVSADGSTVVGVAANQEYQVGFRWREGEGMTPLASAYGIVSYAFAVNDDGNVVVGEYFDLFDDDQTFRPFAWSPPENHLNLNSLIELEDGDHTTANGVSADGSVIVGQTISDNGLEAFTWTAGVGMQGLGDLPGGSFFSEANAVSADGTRVVGRATCERGQEAFLWDADQGMVGLGFLADDEPWSRAMAMSPDARFIVGEAASPSGTVAFLWTFEDGMREIGDLPGGIGLSVADAVSADGSVVVGAGHDDNGQQAIFWSQSTGLIALKDLLAQQGLADQLAGWRLTYAHDISDDGRVIVGEGWNPQGEYEAWRAVVNPVPEPAALTLVAVGTLVLTFYMRTRRAHRQEHREVDPKRHHCVTRLGFLGASRRGRA
jgi:probable HAF family extracellular repeat protein